MAVRQPALDYEAWWRPQRQKAAKIVQRYHQFQPALQAAIDIVLPPPQKHQIDGKYYCLGLHIRHSDKANQRRRIAVQEFIPYLQVYFDAMQPPAAACVYLATDSHQVVQEIQAAFSMQQQQHIIYTQPSVLRSTNTSAVFALTTAHHATNWQVLVDIGALAQCCQWLLHGLSAVSEAALYHMYAKNNNNASINLEIKDRISPQEFRRLVQETMQKSKNS